jgi:hypothetical protein
MSVTFTFHTVAESKPAHGEDIIWLKKVQGFHEGFDPRQIQVEYVWDDEEGTTCGYNGEKEVEGCTLKILFDGWEADDDDLWIPLEEYWGALDKVGL